MQNQPEGQSGFVNVPPEHPRHDFVLAKSSEQKPGAREKQLCEICDVPFNDHAHRLTYLQKVVASSCGKVWKRCSFKERQTFKAAAVAWMAAQLERKLKPFIESVERGPESTDTPSPTTA
jgi:hypothetical protein